MICVAYRSEIYILKISEGCAVHIMADYLAESRQCHQQMLEGRGWRRRSKEADVAMFIGQIRCTLSLEAVKAHARL